jgi:hypothetical protein
MLLELLAEIMPKLRCFRAYSLTRRSGVCSVETYPVEHTLHTTIVRFYRVSLALIVCLFSQIRRNVKSVAELRARTVYSSSDYTISNLYRSYFKGISVDIELQVYNVTCC